MIKKNSYLASDIYLIRTVIGSESYLHSLIRINSKKKLLFLIKYKKHSFTNKFYNKTRKCSLLINLE